MPAGVGLRWTSRRPADRRIAPAGSRQRDVGDSRLAGARYKAGRGASSPGPLASTLPRKTVTCRRGYVAPYEAPPGRPRGRFAFRLLRRPLLARRATVSRPAVALNMDSHCGSCATEFEAHRRHPDCQICAPFDRVNVFLSGREGW